MQTQCKRCVMDGSAKEIVFTEAGCNFCDSAMVALKSINWGYQTMLDEYRVAKTIKSEGKYDCLIGLSGGVDSSYLLHKAVRLGLRPLCFTIDNGWNKPEADENIMRLVEALKVPFFRYTINLEKFRKLQAAFIQAGVPNIEIPTDHILMAASFEIAAKYGIKTILSGGNVATESIMPASWGYSARDLVHIKDIYRIYAGEKLTGLPTCSLLKWNYYRWIKKIKTIYLLDYMHYNRKRAETELQRLYGFRSTGAKHEESIFTSWHMNFYLFEKFGVDKRKAHLSSEIISGQITRKEALDLLDPAPIYPRIGLEQKALQYPKHSHYDYKTDEWLYNLIARVIKTLQWRS